MLLSANDQAAILLLRGLADQIEKGELIVSSLSTGEDGLNPSDPYATTSLKKLEVATRTAPLFKANC
jgi:hypothetical protein